MKSSMDLIVYQSHKISFAVQALFIIINKCMFLKIVVRFKMDDGLEMGNFIIQNIFNYLEM